MSSHNKVNKDSYTQAGRLTPDDMARERKKQTKPNRGPRREGVTNRARRANRAQRGERAPNSPRIAREE